MDCLHILIVLVFAKLKLSDSRSVLYNNCDIPQPARGILDLKQEHRPATFLNATTTYSLKDCSKICCNKTGCNAYIWRNSEQCFLFHCKVSEDCRVVPYQGTITGFVNRRAETNEIFGSSCDSDTRFNPKFSENKTEDIMNVQKSINSQILKDNDVRKLKILKEQKSSVASESKVRPVSNDDVTISKSVKVLGETLDSEVDEYKRTLQKSYNITTKLNGTMSTKVVKPTSLKQGSSAENSTASSVIPMLNNLLLSQKITHTTTTSLIAALAFGVIFLATVLVLIVRPWWQSIVSEREGYSRVTFLFNGK
eukprot:gene13006-14344_t